MEGVPAAPCTDPDFDAFGAALGATGVSASALLDAEEAKLERRRQREGGYRLPAEAEWEYAARAGSTTSRHWGDAGPSCRHANGADFTTAAQVPGAADWPAADCSDGHAYTAPVGSYPANAFGLHDMLGNVWEWTQGCWYANHEGAPSDGSARATGDCSQRAVRGGSWEDAPLGLRAAYRVGSPTVIRVWIRGFRVARTN